VPKALAIWRFAELPPSEVLEDPSRAIGVEDHSVGDQIAVEIEPAEAADASGVGKRPLHRKAAVAVVSQHDHRAVHRRDDDVEIAFGVDVGGPRAPERHFADRRRYFRGRGDVREAAILLLAQDPEAAVAGQYEICPVVVVEVGSEDAAYRGRDRRGATWKGAHDL
jgi:hypothetical protein